MVDEIGPKRSNPIAGLMRVRGILRRPNRIRRAASGHLEIGHTLWFSVVLKVSEQFLSSFQVL